MEELVSVIVPVYNVEKYLKKCITSINTDRYRNVEIILVDDGSTDSSGKICDECAEKDGRITVLHKENGGLSSARNAGIDVSNGKYIMFVDSDDYIVQDTIYKCMKYMNNYKADIAQFNYYRMNEEGLIVDSANYAKSVVLIDNKKCREKLYKKSDSDIVVNVWNKIYSREVIGNTRFVEGKNYEDNMFMSDIIDKNPTVLMIPECLYYYTLRSDSITGATFSKKKLDRIYAMDYILNKYSYCSQEYKYVTCWKVSILFQLYYEIYKSNDEEKKLLLKDIKKQFNEAFAKCFFYKRIFGKYFLFYIMPSLFCIIFGRIKKH